MVVDADITDLYVNRRLSCKHIADLVGVSEGCIWKRLKKQNLIRSRSESALNTNKKCDYRTNFVTGELTEVIDGFMLSDGHIQKRRQSARLAACLKEENFCDFLAETFACYDPQKSCYINKSSRSSPIKQWRFQTKSHPDWAKQRKRWYKNKTKVVPNDVRITPLSVGLWFCGDGTRGYQGASPWAYFCTEDFCVNDVEVLSEKLQQVGIDCHRTKRNRIYVSTTGYQNLLKYAACPVKCYSYKFVD